MAIEDKKRSHPSINNIFTKFFGTLSTSSIIKIAVKLAKKAAAAA